MFSSTLITANSTPAKVANAVKITGQTNYAATIVVSGTFDSATVAIYLSIDNGATLIALKDITGTAITATSNKMFFVELGGGIGTTENPNLTEQIWAQATGGGGSLSVTVTANSNT